MELLSVQPVSGDYLLRLRADLDGADLVRFAVAYVTRAGLERIGLQRLGSALEHPDSFGIASLTCRCFRKHGAQEPSPPPLFGIIAEHLAEQRLHYFFEPLPKRDATELPDDPDDPHLLHSKLVYIKKKDRSICYIGSHNWTGPAMVDAAELGSKRRRNAEVSTRIEETFAPEQLLGGGSSFAARVNGHLLGCRRLPLLFPATNAWYHQYLEWLEAACPRGTETMALEPISLVLGACTDRQDQLRGKKWKRWMRLEGQSIYIQALRETEGDAIWKANGTILMVVWRKLDHPKRAHRDMGGQDRSPVLISGRLSTINSGDNSQRQGSNRSRAPIEGFDAYLRCSEHLKRAEDSLPRLYDEKDLHDPNDSAEGFHRIELATGARFDLLDFGFASRRGPKVVSDVDHGVNVKYQALFEVEKVVLPWHMLPKEGSARDEALHAALFYPPESLAFHTGASAKTSADKSEAGYYRQDAQRLRKQLTEIFGVEPERCRAVPSSLPRSRRQRFVVDHPLNDALIGTGEEQVDDGDAPFAEIEQAAPGLMVRLASALPVSAPKDVRKGRARSAKGPMLDTYAKPLTDLVLLWTEVQQQLTSSRPNHK